MLIMLLGQHQKHENAKNVRACHTTTPTLLPTRVPTRMPTRMPTKEKLSQCSKNTKKRPCSKNSACSWDKKTSICLAKEDACAGQKRSKCQAPTCSWDKISSSCKKQGDVKEPCGYDARKLKVKNLTHVAKGYIEGDACECEDFCETAMKSMGWIFYSKNSDRVCVGEGTKITKVKKHKSTSSSSVAKFTLSINLVK